MVFFLLVQQDPAVDINFGMLALRMFIFLGLVLVLIYLVLRKFLPMLMQPGSMHNRAIKILERVPIDQKRSLLIVEIQEKAYLLGSAEGQVNVLMELDREKLSVKPAADPQKPQGFESILKRTFHKAKANS